MHVVIPMAGRSRRFLAAGYEGPKALLMVGDKMMIEHVFGMFDMNHDQFHIIVNSAQVEEVPDLVPRLEGLATKVCVCIVPPHEDGPVASALAVTGVPEDAPVIVSYCDFLVDWSYRRFKHHAEGSDGAIASFSGFQPASFGSTFFAYMRTDGDRMLELREKESFSNDRVSEPASAGIYYFRRWDLFEKYARSLLGSNDNTLPEAYVSLLYNPMVQDGLVVVVHPVKRFICLGTPEDLAQYLYWHSYCLGEGQESLISDSEASQTLIVPMAGSGRRFVEAGYRAAKPLIQVHGRPMFKRPVETTPACDRKIFLPRQADIDRHDLKAAILSAYPSSEVVPVATTTSGQAATCLLAEDHIVDDSPLFIVSCDYEHRFDRDKWEAIVSDLSIDGAIWTYRLGDLPTKDPKAFAYCVTEDDGLGISKVVEKETISDCPGRDPMVVGTFWFRKGRDFVVGARRLIESDIQVNGEHYVGTSVNQLIKAGKKFVIFDINQWISYGDPFELAVMEFWQDHFAESRQSDSL